VQLEIDVAPLFGPATRSFFQLDTRGTAVEPPPITDPALAALIGPLEFGFHLESESIDPMSGDRQTQYRLESVQQAPEPGSFCLIIAGALAADHSAAPSTFLTSFCNQPTNKRGALFLLNLQPPIS
jgi:hypothetical protein